MPGIAEVNRKVICYYTCRATKLLLLDPLPLFSAFHNNAHPTIIAASNTSLDLAESKSFMLKLDNQMLKLYNQMWSHPTIIAAFNTSNNFQLHLRLAKETKWQIVKNRVKLCLTLRHLFLLEDQLFGFDIQSKDIHRRFSFLLNYMI